MELQEFIKKNNFKLSSIVTNLCKDALSIMDKSKDPLHPKSHILFMLDNLDKFVNQDKETAAKINYEVLLLSICWHDVWKSYKTQTQNLLKMLYEQYSDGLGSAKIFNKYASRTNLHKSILNQVQYCIRKHSSLQFRKRKTVESKILTDLDKLETWNIKRYEQAMVEYKKVGTLNGKKVRLAKFFFKRFMRKSTTDDYYFSWTKNEFQILKRKNKPKLIQLYEKTLLELE